MKTTSIILAMRLASTGLCLLALTACGPSEKQKAELAEKKRIDCLDKICEGDVEPALNMAKEVALKKNGQWFVGPKEYFSGRSGAVFFWPSKTPETGSPTGENYPEKGKPFYDVAVEIFLTGRHRWANPNEEEPWKGTDWESSAARMRAKGLRIERTTLSPELDVVHIFEADSKPYHVAYYIATQQRRIRGDGPPIASCDISRQPNDARCVAGEYWQADVLADFRFNARHANDWPAIHQEIVRVMNLAKKVQP